MYRVDSLPRYKPLAWERKPDGRLWTVASLGEANKNMDYFGYDPQEGKIKQWVEYVSEDGLFNDESVGSVAGLPIIMGHEFSDRGGNYTLNKRQERVGSVLSSIGREDDQLLAEVMIDDFRAIAKIDEILERGEQPEISSGYGLKDLILREDGRYEQIRGAYKHIAAPLPKGMARAGRNSILRFDSNDEVATNEKLYFDMGSGGQVKDLIVRLDNKDVLIKSASPEVEEVIEALQSKRDEAIADLEGVEIRLDESQQEVESLKEMVEEAKKVDLAALIKTRMDAWTEVKQYADLTDTDYSLGLGEIYKQGIKAIKPDFNIDSLDEVSAINIWKGICLAMPLQQQTRQDSRSYTDEYLQQTAIANPDPLDAVTSAYENAYKRGRK